MNSSLAHAPYQHNEQMEIGGVLLNMDDEEHQRVGMHGLQKLRRKDLGVPRSCRHFAVAEQG